MASLVARAYIWLIHFDRDIRHDNFQHIYESVRTFPCSASTVGVSVSEICRQVDIACIWYWKKVLCLQRSAATVCLLKQFGFAAQLVIGAQSLPFKAHAWVEYEGRVVNDKEDIPEIYPELDRC